MDDDIGELDELISEAERNVERYRSVRRSALTRTDSTERREFLYQRIGVSSITELDSLARIAKQRLADLERVRAVRTPH